MLCFIDGAAEKGPEQETGLLPLLLSTHPGHSTGCILINGCLLNELPLARGSQTPSPLAESLCFPSAFFQSLSCAAIMAAHGDPKV